MLLLIFEKAGINIGMWIITPLYKLAAFAFKIFMILAQSDVLKEIDYGLLLTNFYVILGLIMLFIMAFALLRGIVNPDDQKQGTTMIKNIIINFVVSCIMLGFLPTIFPFMFDVQDSILRYNVIGGFFGFGDTGHELIITDNVNEVEASAYRLVNGVYTAFFNVSDGYCSDFLANSSEAYNSKKEELEACQNSLLADDELHDNGGVPIADNFLTFKQYVDQTGQFGVYSAFIDQAAEGNIDFDFLILLIAGIALLYVGVSYCFDMGLRLIKLIFYQLIAPIPIFLRVIPNSKFSGTFNQWLKVTLTCWMEVFVRIFIFCFCTWLCSAIMETNFISKTVFDYGRTTGLFTTAFILMAVVMFMKRSPKLLSEVTGIDSGNMKLGIKEKLAEGGGFVAGAAVGGLATAGIRNAANAVQNVKSAEGGWAKTKAAFKGLGSVATGGASGFLRSGKAGFNAKNPKDMKQAASTGAKGAVEARMKRANYKAAHGGTFGATVGHIKDVGRKAFNFVTDQSIEGLTRDSQSMAQISSAYSTFSDNWENLLMKEQAKGEGSVFFTGYGSDGKWHDNENGFDLKHYAAFDQASKDVAEARAKFNAGKLSKKDLDDAEAAYTEARDAARDELMNLSLKGTNSDDYKKLNAKAQATMQTGMVDAERLQTTVLANADSQAVQRTLGSEGNKVLDKIFDPRQSLEVDDFKYKDASGNEYKLKDLANIAKGQADIKIAEMQKEEAAKGEKK